MGVLSSTWKPPFLFLYRALLCVQLTVLLSELLCLLVRDVPLSLQVCFVSYENNHLRTQRANRQKLDDPLDTGVY